MSQGIIKFLNLVNCPVADLSKFVEDNEIDKRLIDGRFASLEELLPSVKCVRQQIRFLLFQATALDDGFDIAKEYGKTVGKRHEEVSKTLLRDLKDVADARLPTTLSSHNSSNVANVAYEAAVEFVEWVYTPEDKRQGIKRCMSPVCSRFFKAGEELNYFCSSECEETGRRLKRRNNP